MSFLMKQARTYRCRRNGYNLSTASAGTALQEYSIESGPIQRDPAMGTGEMTGPATSWLRAGIYAAAEDTTAVYTPWAIKKASI